MMVTKRFCAACLFLGLNAGIRAETIAIWVFESGLTSSANVSASGAEASLAWEGGVMDAAFDSGHIVWNAPISRLSIESVLVESEMVTRIKEIGADYLLWMLLDYSGTTPAKPSVRICPSRIEYHLISLAAPIFVAGIGSLDLNRSKNGREDAQAAKAVARDLFARIKDR